MILTATIILFLLAVALMVPVLVVSIECLAALLPERSHRSWEEAPRPSVAVLLPSHNEEAVIWPTITAVSKELCDGDRLIVVADNCNDATAELGRTVGVEVIERNDPEKIGKGYALDFGMRHIEQDPPDVVVVIDADCLPEPGAIDAIARAAVCAHRPVQAAYVLEPPREPSPRDCVSALAFLVKNVVRFRGLERLGCSCILTGTGMAFPWDIIHDAPLASGCIVEDTQLGLDLTVAGYPPLYCDSAMVRSRLPAGEEAARGQRTRWEHGHIHTLVSQALPLIATGLRQRRVGLVVKGLDLGVPPLSLLVMMILGSTVAGVAGGLLGTSWWPAGLLCGELTLLAVSILGAWAKFGRKLVPARSLLVIPVYILWKIPIYAKFLVSRERNWVRTERDGPME